MPTIVWDRVGDREYESGLDRGVLYLPDGSAVPWNGLSSVIESFNSDSSPVYFDGMKINNLMVLGDFAGTLKALTYPDEFVELEGLGELRRGVFLADQAPKLFGLCWRTQMGNDLEGDQVGYKIHLLYNVMAIPKDKTHESLSDQPSMEEFEWEITAIPQETPGFRPTAHFVLDTRDLDPWLLEDLEAFLYGDESREAVLLPMPDLVSFMRTWYRVKITDNGDGTWSATSQRDGFIYFLDPEQDLFQITNVNAVYLNDTTYQISDTTDISEVPQIKITDNGDGTWSATTDQDNLIVMLDDDKFEIRNANAHLIGPNSFRISDTTDEH